MKTIVKFALSVVLALSVCSGAFAWWPDYPANVDFAQVESGIAPVVKFLYKSRDFGCQYAGVPVTYFVGALADESSIGPFGKDEGILGKCNYTATGLPDGVTINTKRGIIYGTPTTVGDYTGTVTATNSKGSASFTVRILIKDGTNAPEYTRAIKTKLITSKESTEFMQMSSDNVYYDNILITPKYYVGTNSVYAVSGSEYPVGYNNFSVGDKDANSCSGSDYIFIVNPEDMEGEWDFSNPDTGDTGTTGVVKSSETPLMAFATTQEVTTDDQEVVADIEVTAPAAAIPSVADVLRGNVTEFDYDLYVMLEIGDGVLFVTDAGDTGELTGETKEFTKRVRSGRHRIFDLKMTPILRLALRGVKVNWYAGCISNDMEVKGQIVTATTEFK
jgi:hypothetical protein